MKKIIFLLLLSTFVLTTPSFADTPSTMLANAEIAGVENEYFLKEGYLSIMIRNPYDYVVIAIVELHEIFSTERSTSTGVADKILMRKYIVLDSREEYELDTKVYVGLDSSGSNMNANMARHYNSYNSYYLTSIKAYRASDFQ